MANKDLIKEYNEWKKKKDARTNNFDYENGANADDLVSEYNSWKKTYETSQQRVTPTVRQPSPQSKREQIVERYAQNAAKYDGMSYADRAAALEQLKINLKNMPSPEQGAEYQYLKNNLLGAEEAQRYANMTREERDAAIMKLRAAQAGVVNTDPLHPRTAIEDAQARQAANDAMKEYAGLEYYLANYDPTMQARTRLAEYGSQKEDVGEFEYNNRQKLGGFYSDFLTGGATRLFGNKEQNAAYDAYKSGKESIAEYEARQKAYDEAIVRLGITRPEEYDELVKKGYGGEATEEQLAESILNNPASDTVPMLRSLRQYTSRGDTLANYMYPQENAMFYALLGKGDIEGAGDYVNSLEKQLIQRAEQAQVEAKAESYKNDGVNGFVRMVGDTLVSIPENMLGSVPALLDEAGQYVTTGEYDPYKSPDTQDVRSARQTRAAGSQYVGDITNHASIGGIEIAPLIYNAGVSALESAAGGYLGKMLQTTAFINNAGKAAEWLGKNTYIFMMGSGAAQQRAEELYQRGASDKQILIGSLTAGINEALFEHFSLENIIDTDKFASYAARVLSQAGIEGSEEIATTLANQLADSITLGNVSDYNEAVRKYLADNPDMDYKTAQKLAAQDAFTGLLEDGLAGMLSGFSAVNIYDAANNVRYNRQNNKIGKNISSNYQAENTVKQGLEADENSEAYKLAKDIDERQKAGKKVSNKALGELARALDTELTEKSGNALEKASEYRREAAAAETVENALKENGATDEEAADLAPLVSKSILGEELTDAEQAKIDNNTAAVRYMDEVGSKTSEISGTTGLQQLALRVNATTRGTGSTKASDRLRESALDKVFETAMRNELKPAKLSDDEIGKANETSYKVSTTGKTMYNGKAVDIDAISEIGDGNALVTLDNGETAKLSEIEFADKGEAVAWQTITSIDGITPQAASSLIAQYKNKPANVTAGVWARGIAEGYEIGRSGKLGTKEFPKAEASAKYLSNIGNDARRISETVGRQDARYEQHKEAIEVERKNVNNKNVNDAADTLDKMGRKYKIVEGIDGDGYIEKDGTIVLNKDAKDPIGFVLKHELTHYAETSKDYDGFVKAVKGSRAFAVWIDKQSLKDGTQLQQEADYLRRLKDRYRRHGVTLTNTEAHREMIANFVGDTLFNENGVGLDGLVNGMNAADRNAVMRFLTKIADFFRKHFTKKGERAYLEHFFSQLQNTATGERTEEKTYSIPEAAEDIQSLKEQTAKASDEWDELREKVKEIEFSEEYRGWVDKIVADPSDENLKAYKKWEDENNIAELFDREKELRTKYLTLQKAYSEAIKRAEIEADEKKRAESGLTDEEYDRNQAVKEFGYTPYFYDAGYILPNGRMLNFSGEKGKHYGSRGQDHRAIGTIYADSDLSGSAAMLKFMDEGNIRIIAETPGVDISSSTEPTKEQYSTIERFVSQSRNKEYFSIDFTDADGNTVANLEYEDRFSPSRVINDIKRYYASGETREQSIVDQFHERYSIPESDEDLAREWVEKGKEFGTFDPGENNTTGILTPQQVNDKTRVERAERTILGDGTLSDEFIRELGKEILLNKRSYEPESDEYAKEYLENATQQELEARVTKVLGNRNLQAGKLDVAAASYLIKQAIANDDTKKALEMEADLSAMLTHAGQFIQGWRLFKQMTPYGKLMSLQRAVRMTNEEVRPGGRKATIDENLAMLLLEAKTEKEQEEAADNITKDVAAQLDSSWLEKWNAWRYMSMLINPRTHARNIIGNAIFVPAVYLKDIIATGFEKIPMFRNALKADERHAVKIRKEYADFAKFFVKDANVERDLKSGWGSFSRGVALEKAVFKGKFEKFRKSMMGFLEKEDMWFKNIHYRHAFASYLQAQRVDTKSLSTNLKQNDKRSQDLIMMAHEYAVSEAFKNTYNDANAFSKMMNDLGRKHAISRFLVDSVVPFRKTPANIVKRGVEYSPIGLLTSISKGAVDYVRTEKVKKQYENGEIKRAEYNKYMSTKGFDGNKFIEKLASGLTGTGIFLLGVLLRSMGVLHGRARDDKDKYLRQLGRQDYSAELFGGTFSIDWAAPMNLPLFMGVELMDLLADTKEGAPIGPSTFTKPMSQFLQPIINLSMLEGVQNAIESVSYSNEGEEVSDFAEAVAASYFTQAMPTFLGAVARIADEKKRAYYRTNYASVDKFVQKVWNDFRAKIPAGYAIGGAIAKPPAIDVWGREISAGGMAQRLIENLVSPGYWKNVNYTDVDKEVTRIYDTTKKNSVIPKKPDKYIDWSKYDDKGKVVEKNKEYLDEWQYSEYCVFDGSYSYGYIADAISNDSWKQLDDNQKVEVISNLYSYAGAKAKTHIVPYEIDKISTYKTAYKYEQGGGSIAQFYINKELNK